MYKPLEFTVKLSFLSEDEDVVKCVIVENDGESYTFLGDHWENALMEAASMMFGGGDLGDLFWPLQHEDE